MITKLKVFGIIGVFIAGVICGSITVRYFWQKSELKNLEEFTNAQEELLYKIEKQKKDASYRQSELLNQLDDLRNRYTDNLRLSEQLRNELSKPVHSTSGNPCKPCEIRLGNCQNLLSEGIGLATEGAELSERIAIKKDNIVNLAK